MKLFGLRTALYARRSKEEHQAASIDVQTGEGSRYIAEQGGTLAPEHIFVDADHGRAEFKKRPGLIAMLNAAERHAFDAVVVRDESRLGGDTNRTSLFIQDLLDAGVRLFYYFTDEEVKIDGAFDKLVINVRNFASELEREKISQRTHEHLLTKARRGLNVGGRVYGYDNIEVKDGEQRVRVEYRVNEEQAKIVREIFRRYADGEGLRTLAKDLNARGVEPPKAGRRGTGSWSYSSIREMVRRERYRGVLVWGKKEKTYKGGTKVRVDRPKSDWVTIEAPELRIVDDELWAAVQQRWSKREALTGSRRRGGRVRYFLTGFGRCAKCGGPMRADNAKVSYDNVRVYACAWHRDRGPAVCDNGLRRPVATVDEAVINCIKENVLHEEVIAEALREMRRRIAERAKNIDNELPQLEREASRLRSEIDRLVNALASFDQKPEAVIRGIAERQDQLSALEARLRAAKAAPSALDLEVRRLEKEARQRLGDLRAMLERNPEEARKALETILGGPLRFTPIETPEGKRYRIEGVVALEAVVAVEGNKARAVQAASPAGFEPA
ncbi:recombinase family protein [Sorangium sp. So ce185]|uniref:recombinase family protein n=1 Tax=Sorangium sp. So ce185 TaxID=3133287 RepID=UPI003F618DEC